MSTADGVVLFVMAGVSAAIVIPIAVTGIITCSKARRGSDPARKGFTWFKLAYCFVFASYVFSIASAVLSGLLYVSLSYSYSYSYSAQNVTNALSTTGNVMARLGDVCFILTCIELGIGFTYALTLQRTTSQKVWRVFGGVSAAILALLSIVASAYGGWALSTGSRSSYYESTYLTNLRNAQNLDTAVTVLFFVVALALLVQASLTKKKYQSNMPAARSVTLYLVATILFFAPRKLWSMIIVLVNTTNGYNRLSQPVVSIPLWLVFSEVTQLVTYILLFVVGMRKSNGLWTTMQPWMNGVPPSMASIPPQQQPPVSYATVPHGTTYMYAQPGPGYTPAAQQGYGQPGYYLAGQYQQPHEVPGAPVQPPSEVSGGETAHMMYSTTGSTPAPQEQQGEYAQVQSHVAYEKP